MTLISYQSIMRRFCSATLFLFMLLSPLLSLTARADYFYNKVLELDGNGDYISVNSQYIPHLDKPFAISAWIKTSSANGDQAVIAQYKAFSGSNLDDSFLLSVHNGYPRFQINPGNQYIILDSPRFVADGNWHHLYAAYNQSKMYLIVDDRDLDQRAASGVLNHPSNTHLRIGALYDSSVAGPGFFFDGQIDEVQLWETLPSVIWSQRIPYRQPTDTEKLLFSWRFNGYPDNGFNASFNGNARIVSAARPRTGQRFYNTNLAFNLLDTSTYAGDNSHVNIIGDSTMNLTNAMTIETVIHPRRCNSTNNRMQSIVSKFRHNSGADSDDAYFLGLEPNGSVRFQISTSNGWRLINSTPIGNSLAPVHLAGVYDGSSIKLYVNGQLEAATTISGNINRTTTPLVFGAGHSGTSNTRTNFFCGKLDDIRIWNQARSHAQIIENGNYLWSRSGPIAWWNFEGDFLNQINPSKYWGVGVGGVHFRPDGELLFEWAPWDDPNDNNPGFTKPPYLPLELPR